MNLKSFGIEVKTIEKKALKYDPSATGVGFSVASSDHKRANSLLEAGNRTVQEQDAPDQIALVPNNRDYLPLNGKPSNDTAASVLSPISLNQLNNELIKDIPGPTRHLSGVP
jgi:hypothetical protein